MISPRYISWTYSVGSGKHGCEAWDEELGWSCRRGGPQPWGFTLSSLKALPEARSPVPSPFPCQVYTADGEFLFKFGSHGEGNGQFNAPTGVAVDSNGNIIVADWGNSRIQVRPRDGMGLRLPAVLRAPAPPPATPLPHPCKCLSST